MVRVQVHGNIVWYGMAQYGMVQYCMVPRVHTINLPGGMMKQFFSKNNVVDAL